MIEQNMNIVSLQPRAADPAYRVPAGQVRATPPYAELQVLTNFSFLEGGSRPAELVVQAAEHGHAGIGIADRNSLAGIVRAHAAAKELGFRLAVGARIDLRDHPSLLCYPTDRAAYGRLTRLISVGRLRAPKGECHLDLTDLAEFAEGQNLILLPPDEWDDGFAEQARSARARFPGATLHLAATHRFLGDDVGRIARLDGLARDLRLPLVATNDVLYHAPDRRPLQDVLTCIREGCTIAEAGFRLEANAERHLKTPEDMAILFRGHEHALANTVTLLESCRFSLSELKHLYPLETSDTRTPQQRLTDLTWGGATRRYPGGVPDKVRELVEKELGLIAELDYAPFFLTVHDIVRYADSKGILCQGRGSAANSAVCYCLHVTTVDPSTEDVLFERFISSARGEPPDIDVDFEHERREEVIQHIYDHYGRDKAAIAATVICYRTRAALREVGKVMGLSADIVTRLSSSVWGWSEEGVDGDRAQENGLDPASEPLASVLRLSRELIGFPRHLSQHVGGFVITRDPLDTIVPITNAAMDKRTVIEWDKDDLDALGLLKVDVLGLGMLTCLRRGFDLLRAYKGEDHDLHSVPREEAGVYDMLCRADSVGVFQVESRAQMNMLPRLKPRKFYDLVIEVAIVRPGPIQGDMVHPYLRRREKLEPVIFPKPELEDVLGKTLGVPLFQEQAMKVAIVAAKFSPDDADRLRRAMATFKESGHVEKLRDKLIEGMVANGYERDFAERCYRQIEGFGTYGFPESHAVGFAKLVYISAWLKWKHPDVFACALINSQPMGFYAPAQIVRDAREHGVEVREADINHSDWDCTLERLAGGRHALRLGLRLVRGFGEDDARKLTKQRGAGYADIRDLWRRSGLDSAALGRLAAGDAFRSLGLDRRRAEWAVRGLGSATPLPLFAAAVERPREPAAALPEMELNEHVVLDYATLGLSLKQHPMALMRADFAAERVRSLDYLATARGSALIAGLVLVRQRPGEGNVVFVTLEDETGVANLVVFQDVFQRHRRIVMGAAVMVAEGIVERDEKSGVTHLLVRRMYDRTDRLRALARPLSRSGAEGSSRIRRMSRDFH